MKKSVKLKKFGLTAATLVVCLAIMATCFALSFPSFSAFADEASATTIFSGIRVAETCDYGEDIEVKVPSGDTKVQVTAPNGTTVALGTASGDYYQIPATQVGSYTVTYYKGDSLAEATAKYDFRVYVSLNEEYFLRVDNNGADIPTYKKTGEKFTLPDAGVYYYDENKILREYEDAEITVTSSDSALDCGVGKEIACETSGKLFFTYTARLGNDGNKYLSQSFTVNVQDSFEDISRPTLTVAGVSSNISIKRPVTLPKATATDDSDENVKITITVTGPVGKYTDEKGNVRIADVDDNGYGYIDTALEGEAFEKAYPTVKFDNDEAMTFYPMEEGTYVVEYVATDDEGNTSTKRQFTMTAGDRVAPVFKDIADDAIPEKWGVTVKNSADGDALDNAITFPVPTVVDNKSHVWEGESDESSDLIDLLFRITDSDNNRVIVEFTDVLSKDSSKYTKTSSVYDDGAEIVFDKNTGFKFELGKYDRKDSSGNVMSKAGTYTVYYRAGDAAGNHSSKTYTIVVEDNFVDSVAPAIENLDVQEYIATTESFTVPSPVATDANDTRLSVEYGIYSDADHHITVKGGEKAAFKTVNEKTYLVLDEDEEEKNWLELVKDSNDEYKLYFLVKASDDVNNVTYNTTDNTDNYLNSESVIAVIGENEQVGTYTGNIAFSAVDTEDGVNTDGDFVAGYKINAGEFQIETSESLRKYTGFEIGAYDKNGNPVNVELTTYTVKDDYENPTAATVYVKNIQILPTTAGEHTLNVRVFNVNGYSTVTSYKFNVAASTAGPGGTGSASTIGTNGSVNVTYKLKNETINNVGTAGTNYCVVRKINSTSVYALMGSEITFKTQGSARIQDGYGEVDNDPIASFVPYGADDGKYTVSVTDTASPVIEVQGAMPMYAAKKDDANIIDGKVVLPSVVGYTENGSATITVSVSSGNDTVKTDYDEATNKYSFVATTDGVYNVTYTAVAANGASTTATYSITVGDVKGPEFERDGTGTVTGKVRVNDKFTFDKLTLKEGEDATDVRVTKKLLDPTGAEVTSATVTGSFNTYASYTKPDEDNDIVLTMSGDYIVEYTVTDKAGNATVQRVKINVASKGSGKPKTFTGLSIALTVIAVVLLAGVIIYVVRFRKVKSK